MTTTNEFDEWAERFDYRTVVGQWNPDRNAYDVKQERRDPPRCMYPMKEGPHKVAHNIGAHHRSIDGYPVCQFHAHKAVRPAWRGYIEGA